MNALRPLSLCLALLALIVLGARYLEATPPTPDEAAVLEILMIGAAQ